MPPSEEDAAYLWDMLEAARAVARFIAGRAREQYLADEVLQAAIERKIEIVGDAARNVSDPFQKAHPEIPWSKIMGQRHVLAHDYGRIEHDRIWSVVSQHLPALVPQLESLLASGEHSPGE
jgi:uncharacterized protein with HEPN domain